MTARYEQLQEFNETGEGHEINREQPALVIEPQAEGKPGCRKN